MKGSVFALNFRSRRKLFLVGSIFILVTATVYGLFILSILKAMVDLKYNMLASIVINLVALVFGFMNIKEYFYFKKGPSLTISDKGKDSLLKGYQGVVKSRNNWAVVAGTIVVAAMASIVELPCTAGFPVI